jgi:hypothetical protein
MSERDVQANPPAMSERKLQASRMVDPYARQCVYFRANDFLDMRVRRHSKAGEETRQAGGVYLRVI